MCVFVWRNIYVKEIIQLPYNFKMKSNIKSLIFLFKNINRYNFEITFEQKTIIDFDSQKSK